MPSKLTKDDDSVPMQVLQSQRIKVLEAQKAELQQQVQQLQARVKALEAAGHLPAVEPLMRGRRPTYTVAVLREVWTAYVGGEPLQSIAERLKADAKMMRIFVKGEYWTEAAKAVYAEFGIGQSGASAAASGAAAPVVGPQTV